MVREELNVKLALARAIEFGEKDSLPAAQGQLAVFDKNKRIHANEHGLEVRIGVAFRVAIESGRWDEAVKGAFGVGGDIGIGVFVDEDARGGVGNVK